MFNFRTTTILFFIFLAGMNLLAIAGYPVSWIWYLILVLTYIGISITASFFITSGFHMKALCRGITEKKEIALSFDDGPDPEMTPKVLDVLKEHNVKATFFLIGKKIEGNEELVRMIVDQGHLVGSHSHSHAHLFDFYPPKMIRRDIIRSIAEISEVSGRRTKLFRPPYGVINPFVKKALKGLGLHVTGFSNRAFDTVSRDPERIVQKISEQLSPGDIVVLHDTHPSMDVIVKKLLEAFDSGGYTIVPLDKMLKIDAYES